MTQGAKRGAIYARISEDRYDEAEGVDRQREAAELQARAMQILSETVAEQGKVIAALLVPDLPPMNQSSVS